MTNGDRIRQMSNEELAKFFVHNTEILECDICVHDIEDECEYKCIEGIKAYLDTEVEE